MFNFNDIPRNPDSAVIFLSELLSNNLNRFFTTEGEFIESSYTSVINISKTIMTSCSASSFKSAPEISNHAKSIVELLERGHLSADNAKMLVIRIESDVLQERLRQRFELAETDPLFTLKKDEIDKIMKLSTKMRVLITTSDVFDDNHKRRLLDRLASIEAEIHKNEGRFDVILAGIVDVGDAVGKAGKKAQPLAILINKIRGIVQSNSEEYDNLPAPDEPKRLPAPNKVSVKKP